MIKTQADLILEMLLRFRGSWVPMPDLAAASGAYAVHSRIADLRADGHPIASRVEGSRPKRSFYMLQPITTDRAGATTHLNATP